MDVRRVLIAVFVGLSLIALVDMAFVPREFDDNDEGLIRLEFHWRSEEESP